MDIKNAGQLLAHLATKAGIDINDQNLKNLLSSSELTKITVHSDVVKALDENLLSVDAATDNHPLIGTKYKAQALNAIDKKMEDLMEQLGLDDTSKAELKGVRSSYDRLEKLGAKMKELSSKKDDAEGSKDKNALQKQIDDLLGKLQQEKKTFEEQLGKVQAERQADKIGFEKRTLYGNIKTIYDPLDPAVRAASIDAILNKSLQDKDAEFSYDEQGNFILRKKDGTNLVGANHTKYTPQSFIEEVLAQNKILAVNTQQQQNAQQQQQQQKSVDAEGHQINGTNQSVADLNMQAMKSFQQEQ